MNFKNRKFWRTRNFFFRLFRPSFWMASTYVDWELDQRLNELLDTQPEVKFHYLTASIGWTDEIWFGNYPYSYGCIHVGAAPLPAPITRLRIRTYLRDTLLGYVERARREHFTRDHRLVMRDMLCKFPIILIDHILLDFSANKDRIIHFTDALDRIDNMIKCYKLEVPV